MAEHAALDINAANEHDGLTPFWAAACMGHEPICRLLYSAGADPSATPHRSTHAAHVGAPAFWVACEQGRTAVVRLLASLGLHATEDLNHPYAQNALRLKLGKPTTHLLGDGRRGTAEDAAQCNDHSEIVSYLKLLRAVNSYPSPDSYLLSWLC